MKRDVITDPNPILREPAQEVDSFDMSLQTVIDDMVETMRGNNGIGLAAPQIGASKQILVCELDDGEANKPHKKEAVYEPFPLTVICNPKITAKSQEKVKIVEGCLSFPGFEIVVNRPKDITIEGQDRYGKPLKIKAEKLFARVLQHELDHLNSTLLIDHLKEMKVVLFAGGDFALKTLEYLHKDQQYQIAAVVTTKQHSKVRGKQVDTNLIKKAAEKMKIKVIEVSSLNDPTTTQQITMQKADLGIVVDFGLIIPAQLIDAFKYKIVNVHPSILPRYRGCSPIQSTILNGDKYAGVTIMQIDSGMDTGPILAQYKVKLKGRESFPILKEYLADLGATLLLDTLPYYITTEIKPRKQREQRAVECQLIQKSDGEVRQSDSPILVDRKIRAYNPWPGVYTILDNLRIGISAAHLDKSGSLVIERVKPAGKTEMSYQDFVNGYKRQLTFGENIDRIEPN